MRLVKESFNSKPSEGITNPVDELWEIELVYGKHPSYSQNTYAVIFTTKLEGNSSKAFLVIDLNHEIDKKLRELNVFGSMEIEQFYKVIDYVKQLKINGIFRKVADLLVVLEDSEAKDESFKFFGMVVDAVLSEPDAFPTITSDAYKHGISSGVILDTKQYVSKYGKNALGVTSEALLEILNFEEGTTTKSARFMEIIRGWISCGLLIKRTSMKRFQEQIKPNINSQDVQQRFYVFKFDGLEQI